MTIFVFPELYECFIRVDCLMLKIGLERRVSCIDRYTMIQAGLCLITDGLYFTGFPFSSLLGGGKGGRGTGQRPSEWR